MNEQVGKEIDKRHEATGSDTKRQGATLGGIRWWQATFSGIRPGLLLVMLHKPYNTLSSLNWALAIDEGI